MRSLNRQGRMRLQSGFTLIELLIVVAIIAILAAIAVPNFLEAQIRSKVSAVKSNQRTIAIALEAYYIDWNNYPVRQAAAVWRYADSIDKFYALSTPVAYITGLWSAGKDPFQPDQTSGDFLPCFRFYNRLAGMKLGTLSGTDWHNSSPPFWYVLSMGPDRVKGPWLNPWTNEWGEWGHLHAFRRIENVNDPTLITMKYDPSNGSISGGDVFRYGP